MISSSSQGFMRAGAKVIEKATGKAISRQISVVAPAIHSDLTKM